MKRLCLKRAPGTVLGLGLWLGLLCAAVFGQTFIERHKITLDLLPEEKTLKATDEMALEIQGAEISFSLNKSFQIHSVKVDGVEVRFRSEAAIDKKEEANIEGRASRIVIDNQKPGRHAVVIEYEGIVYEEPSTSQFSREYIANQTSGIIGPKGTFLSPESCWYPKAGEKMSRFEVQTRTPAGYETITDGTRLRHELQGEKLIIEWKNENPVDSLYLQAGPYSVKEDAVDGIAVITYFFPGGEELAQLYLQKSKQYLAMYNELLGRYPYQKFAVVENFFETGYGMPSWTLLGQTVVRLPFIPDTSLPHEICHNWWGNGVFVDYEKGNWCEGLTTYCADYLLKNKASAAEGADYRRQLNRDYASYVKGKKDFPLVDFRARYDPATRAVGYGKSMMVFHDLERRVGEEKFFRALRRLMADYCFKPAGWKDVLQVFEKECGLKLDSFYEQWVLRPGAPVLRLEDVAAARQGDGYIVKFSVVQEGSPYALNVPLTFKTDNEIVSRDFSLQAARENYEVKLESRPLRLEVDPDNHLFRRLYPQEIPPSIAKVFGSEKQLIVIPVAAAPPDAAQFRTAADMINRTKTGVVKTEAEVTAADLPGRSLILFVPSAENPVLAGLLKNIQKERPWDAALENRDDAGSVVVYRHPQDEENAVLVIEAKSQADVLGIVRKLPHYGKYSYLLFHKDQNVAKGIWDVESSPLIHVF